ncbi:SusC/RagA family TonB-linked outer membrane protein [Pseudobacter ginsenosidimutans]|uniref:TonB-linked SusC/RagA family outer membrane protein n=1 Tax=Pseudobacter ginsenosidimutans TaxID=661488 RepID=A0A4Q7ML05_9BACT|nr:SusC/RagA family TonB-linked outer membrane protein [Pseudobacter ginsenosidimutans]QEC40296.1 SusC/RagA family TonB-linked outer membrane protein [Pseudobacter ginsenosidimutans]RZS69101.1 TonB-linked SusC/RagA family outer membrane protein [Pseudobacter ginsenosidimutans]
MIIGINGKGYAQQNFVDTAVAIVIVKSNPTVRGLLRTIEKQVGVIFSYSNSDIDIFKRCELPASVVSLGTILRKITTIFNSSYIIIGRDIVFTKAEQPVHKDLYFVKAEEMEKRSLETALQDVVVIGFSPESRSGKTSSVSYVYGKDLYARYNPDLAAGLQGKIPGLLITETNGAPGVNSRIQIRGQQSIGLLPGAENLPVNNPLILINGINALPNKLVLNKLSSMAGNPTNNGSGGGISLLDLINPEDIEDITILKDADATALYGSRGAHGVIQIQTRKETQNGPAKFSAQMATGIARAAFRPKMMNTEQYAAMKKEALANAGFDNNPVTAPELYRWPLTRYTDWTKYLIGNTAQFTLLHTTVRGNIGPSLKFYAGLGLRQEDLILPTDDQSQQYGLHINLNYSKGKKLNTSFDLTLSNSSNTQPSFDPMPLLRLAPNAPALLNEKERPVFEENGLSFTNIRSVLRNTYFANTDLLMSSIKLDYAVTQKIIFKLQLGVSRIKTYETSLIPVKDFDILYRRAGLYVDATTYWKSFTVEPHLQYRDSSYNGNSISLTIGTNYLIQKESSTITYYNHNSGTGLYGFLSDNDIQIQNNHQEYRYLGMFGGMSYDIRNRFSFNFTIRNDGSSNISSAERFTMFGAFGAGWNFLSGKIAEKIGWLKSGKLRGSIGIVGNDQYGDYKSGNELTMQSLNSLPLQNFEPRPFRSSTLDWEKTTKKDLTLELGFGERLSTSIAWYHNITSKQFISVPLSGQRSASFGYPSNHQASVLNTGFEFWLESKPVSGKKFRWQTSVALTLPKNKLLSFKDLESSIYKNFLTPGQSLTAFPALVFTGVDPATGEAMFQDINKDGKISFPEDQIIIGDRAPTLYGSLHNQVSFKQWELTVFIEGRQQKNLDPIYFDYQYSPGSFRKDMLSNQSQSFLQRWRVPGDQASLPRLVAKQDGNASSAINNFINSSRMLTDASYLRLRTLMISWSQSNNWRNDQVPGKVKVFIAMQNLFTLTRYKGGDPTIQNPMEIPSVRSFMLGFAVKL